MGLLFRHSVCGLIFILCFAFFASVLSCGAQENVLDVSGAARVLIAETPAVQQNFSEMTIECWMKPSRIFNTYAVAVHRNTQSTTIGASLWFIGFNTSGNLVVTINAVHSSGAWQDGQTSVTPAADEWHHVAGTWDGTNGYVYLNGVEIHSYASNPMSANTAREDAFAFGATGIDAASYPYDGLISEVRLWSVKRSEAEIQATMNSRLTGMEYGLVGYWPINEGAGTQTDDYTGNESHGTLDGATAWVVANDLELAPAEGDYIISTPFTLADKQTENTDFTNSNEVDIVDFPVPDGFDLYQFTAGEDSSSLDQGGWLSTNPAPAELSFAEPAGDENIIRYAWFTNAVDPVIMRRASGEIRYTTALPLPAVTATYSRGKAPAQDVVVYPWEIDDGSTGGTTGGEEIPVHSLYLRVESGPDADATPEEPFITVSATGTYHVTLTVTNVAGNAATSTACELTIEEMESAVFVWEGNVDNDWFEALNWDLQAVPFDGSEVIVNEGADIMLDSATANLAAFEMNGGVLTFTNWNTKLSAVDMNINSGIITHVENFVLSTNELGEWVPIARVYLECDSFLLGADAVIDAADKGYPGGQVNSQFGRGPGGGRGCATNPRGGSHGGLAYGMVEVTYDSLTQPEQPGSGGGRWDRIASPGGGAVRIDAGNGEVVVNGTITADGKEISTSGRSGAGSGGSVWISCATIQGSGGRVTALGGADNNRSNAGSGGGGRIAVDYDVDAQALLPVPDVSFSAAALVDRVNDSSDGTLYFSDSRFLVDPVIQHGGVWSAPDLMEWNPGSLIISNTSLTFLTPGLTVNAGGDVQILAAGGRLVFSNASVRVDGDLMLDASQFVMMFEEGASRILTINGNATLTNNALWRFTAAITNETTPADGGYTMISGALSLAPECWIYPQSQLFNGGSLRFRAGSLDIAANAGFNADQRGFSSASAWKSPGYGPGAGGANGGGGGYGGEGGPPLGGVTYGSAYAPTQPGSGAGIRDRYSGHAGGLIWLDVDGHAKIDGSLTANGGSNASDGGGSSGGGILLSCMTLETSATTLFSATGGSGSGATRGDGGGGRIAVWLRYMAPEFRDQLLAGYGPGDLPNLMTDTDPDFWDHRMAPFEGATDVSPGVTAGNAFPGTVVFLRMVVDGIVFSTW